MNSITHYRNLSMCLPLTYNAECVLCLYRLLPVECSLCKCLKGKIKELSLSAMYNSLEITPLTATSSCSAIKTTQARI